MAEAALNKHRQNSARTRDKLIETAVELYGSRSIDAVSLREISVAAGQKNPNALQYHFQNREGLLQAIVDKHSARVGEYRQAYLQRAKMGEWPAPEAAARCLVMPIIDYIDASAEAANFVKVVSQMTALNQMGPDQTQSMGVKWPNIPALRALFAKALSSLPPREAQRRIFLVVNTAFHSIADICKVSDAERGQSPMSARTPMVEQLIYLLQCFFAAPHKK